VLLCALCYGTAVVFARHAFEHGSNAITVVAVRCTFAALAIGIALRVSPSALDSTRGERKLLLLLGVLFALNVFAFYRAVELLRVPLAILIFYVNPLLVAFVGVLAGMGRLGGRSLAFALLSLAGLALATGASPESVEPAGVAWALLAALLIAFILVITTRRLPHVDARSRAFWMMASTSVALWAAMLASGGWAWPASMSGSAAIAGVCVLYAIGLVALFTSAVSIGPVRTAVVMNLEPLVAIAGSWLLLGQGLTPVQLAGGVLVLAGVLGSQLSGNRSGGSQGPGAVHPPPGAPSG